MGILSFVFLICSLRTNVILVAIFVCATMGFSFDAAGLWYTAQGDAEMGKRLTIGCGAIFFFTDFLFWYLFMGSMITIMELPLPDLPVFDLSTVVKAKSRTTDEEAG